MELARNCKEGGHIKEVVLFHRFFCLLWCLQIKNPQLVYQCLNKDHSTPFLFFFFLLTTYITVHPNTSEKEPNSCRWCYPSLLRQLTGSINNSNKRQENKNNPHDKALSETSLCRALKHLKWLHSKKSNSKLETAQLPTSTFSDLWRCGLEVSQLTEQVNCCTFHLHHQESLDMSTQRKNKQFFQIFLRMTGIVN